MNCLNSIILEGKITNVNFMENAICFTISVERHYKNEFEEMVTEISHFDIECYGDGYRRIENKFKEGRGIRTVGRLKQKFGKDESGKNFSKIIVVAEHIEFKPEN